MHLTSYMALLLFHGTSLIQSCKMPLTILEEYANIVFIYFLMHYYFGHTAIPPLPCYFLWLILKLWMVFTALCSQEFKTSWHRTRREARDAAMCERIQHSLAKYPSMVNQQKGTGARTHARHPEIQLQGSEMENQPPSSPLFPHSQHIACIQRGGGVLGEGCVVIQCKTFTI